MRAYDPLSVLLALLLALFSGCGKPISAGKRAASNARTGSATAAPEYKSSAAGDFVEGAAFRLRLLPPTAAVTPGKNATLQVELEAKSPWHVNLEYPVTVRMAKSADWQETPLEISSDKALEYTLKRARLAWEVSTRKNGQFPVLTEVAFAMCTAELCTLEKQEVKTVVRVQ